MTLRYRMACLLRYYARRLNAIAEDLEPITVPRLPSGQRPLRPMPLPRCAFCERKEMIGVIACADGVTRRACSDCWELLAAYGAA